VGPAALAAAVLLCYGPVLWKLALRWGSPDDSYCALIPALVLYLCWCQREGFDYGRLSPSPAGLAALGAGVGLTLLGEVGSLETLLYAGLWTAVAGIALLLYGRRTRSLLFPLVVLAFIVPLPAFLNQALTFRLKLLASSLAVVCLRAAGLAVHLEGNVLDLGGASLQMADACSGLRYVMPMALAGLLLGRLASRGWWRVGLLFLLGIPVSVLVNAGRVAAMGFLTAGGHPEVASGLAHDLAGWAVFLLGTGLLAAAAAGARRLLPPAPAAQDQAGRGLPGAPPGALPPLPAGRQRLSLQLLLSAVVLLAAGAWGLHAVPSRGSIPERASFASFPLDIAGWQGTREYLPREILDELWADDYLSARFTREGDAREINVLIPYYARQSTRHTAHAPQSCLLGGGWNLLSSEERGLALGPGRTLPVRTMVLEKGGAKILADYFFLQRGRVVTSPWAQKVYLAWDAVTRGRTDGALVRVEMALGPGQELGEARRVLEAFIGRVWELLPRFVPP
jgi:exosortase D (VPLPA-CTERM-specific)